MTGFGEKLPFALSPTRQCQEPAFRPLKIEAVSFSRGVKHNSYSFREGTLYAAHVSAQTKATLREREENIGAEIRLRRHARIIHINFP